MPDCTEDKIEFGRLGRRLIEADFSGGDLSSDGGMMRWCPADSCGLGVAVVLA